MGLHRVLAEISNLGDFGGWCGSIASTRVCANVSEAECKSEDVSTEILVERHGSVTDKTPPRTWWNSTAYTEEHGHKRRRLL